MSKPSYYEDMAIQPWDVVDTWPLDQRIGAYRSAAVKYLMRMGSKDDEIKEVGKALACVTKLLETLATSSLLRQPQESPSQQTNMNETKPFSQ